MFARLGPVLVRRRRLVIIGWLAFFAVAVAVGPGALDRLHTDSDGAPGTESELAFDRLAELGLGSPDLVALVDGVAVTDPAVTDSVTAAAATIERRPGVLDVATTYDDGPLLTATDGQASLVAVMLDPALGDEAHDDLVAAVEDDLRAIDAPEVLVGGVAVFEEEQVEQTERDLQKAELITLPIVLVLAVVIFGGLVAASLPLAVALIAVPGALFVLWGLTTVTDVHVFALNVATMLGLGLAIDYALLVVNRFREERAAGRPVDDAVAHTVRTAGVTVAFSGLTVAVALGGFLAFRDEVFPSIGLGSIGVVLLAMLSAVTLLPAILAGFGHRIRPARQTERSGRFFARVATLVQRRAAVVATVVGAGLVLLAVPFLHVRLEIPGPDSLPDSLETRQLFDEREARFVIGGDDPVTVVADTVDGAALAAYTASIAEVDGVAGVQTRATVAGTTVIDVLPDGPAQGATAESVVHTLRNLEPGFDTAVTGPAADLIDQRDALYDRLPWALGFVALSTLVLLFLLTGSVVVPLKAMVMNLLSLTATFGVLVWGFQDGHLGGLLGFDSTGYLGLWLPFLVFFIAFGLSMDYEVFLLARMKEIHDQTGDNDLAVTLGLQRTGRIITSAAVLIGVVFAAFATGETVEIKALGVGLAVAILLDATIVRTLFVPATMKLMGEWNWWAPAPLRRLHDRIGLHEPPSAAPADDHVLAA